MKVWLGSQFKEDFLNGDSLETEIEIGQSDSFLMFLCVCVYNNNNLGRITVLWELIEWDEYEESND